MGKKAVRGFVEAGEVMPKFEGAPSLPRTSPAHLTRPCAHAISFFSHICFPPLSLCTVNALVAVSMAGSVPVLCATSRSTVRSGECQTQPPDGWMDGCVNPVGDVRDDNSSRRFFSSLFIIIIFLQEKRNVRCVML